MQLSVILLSSVIVRNTGQITVHHLLSSSQFDSPWKILMTPTTNMIASAKSLANVKIFWTDVAHLTLVQFTKVISTVDKQKDDWKNSNRIITVLLLNTIMHKFTTFMIRHQTLSHARIMSPSSICSYCWRYILFLAPISSFYPQCCIFN